MSSWRVINEDKTTVLATGTATEHSRYQNSNPLPTWLENVAADQKDRGSNWERDWALPKWLCACSKDWPFATFTSSIIHLIWPPETLRNLCFLFLLGIRVVPREIKDNAYTKFWGASKVYYGRCANGNRAFWQCLLPWVEFWLLYYLLRLKKAREKRRKEDETK